jgi:flavin-dependent dehydrogenase
MPLHDPASEVLIVGGGPAGATAARLLAQWGRRVHLVARPAGDDPDLPESLTPSCGKLFDLMGIRPAVDAAPFVHSRGHTVWWGSPAPRVEPFADGLHGWQATTSRLSAVMLGAAAQAGCTVERRTVTAEETLAWPATYRLDCTGRAGLLAKPYGQRRYEPGHRTVALVGRWRLGPGWPLDDPTHTLLESYVDGWAWSVPLDDTDRAVAVMVDPRTTALARGDGAAAVYRQEVRKTLHLGRMVARADLAGGPWGWDASMYSAERPAGDSWLLVGDAASFIDPLSSAGVKKAMASGWLAAVALNTALARPRHKEMAFAFHAAREAETYAQFLALTRQHLRDGAPSDHPFWTDRAAAVAPAGDERAAVQAAFDRIRDAATLALQLDAGVRFETRPALAEREIVLERRLVAAGVDDGIRFLHGVDVVALTELAPTVRQVPDLYAAYRRQAGPVDLPAFLTTLATAVARGWLRGA